MEAIRKIRLRGKTVLFKNCDDMMIYDYMQIVEKGNLNHLVKSGAMPKKKILEDRMDEINKEFSKLRGKENLIKQFDMMQYKEELILQVHCGAVLIDTLQTQVAFNLISSKTFEGLITQLESWGFYIEREIPIIDALINIKSEIEALQLTIESLEEELNPTKEKTPEIEEEAGRKSFNFHSLLFMYQRILKIDKIKVKETSLTEFAVLEKQVEDAQKLVNKNNAA